MMTLRPSLLLLLFAAIPFLSIQLDPEKGGGSKGGRKDQSKGLNQGVSEMAMEEEDQKRYDEHATEEGDLNLQEAKETKKERNVEESRGEVKVKKKGKAGRWKEENGDLRLGWVILMEDMLKALKEKASDKDPRQEIVDLENHLEEVKSRATEWEGLAKEKMSIIGKSDVTQKREEMGKQIDKNKKKSKRSLQRRDTRETARLKDKTNDGDSQRNYKTPTFPLQSFSKVPSASKEDTVQKFLSDL